MKILVCGSRDYKNSTLVYEALDLALEKFGDNLIVLHGGCPTGADFFADEWARDREVDCVRVAAKWKKHGKAAGPIRNRRAAQTYRPDLVLAYMAAGEPNKGTRDMVEAAKAQKIEVLFGGLS